MKERGILLIATTHPYYGRMAYNLAVSIRATGSLIPITVLYNGRGLSHLSERQKEIFTEIKEIPQEAFEAKLWIFEHSPYDRTLYLDCDMAWLPKKKPEDLFSETDPSISFMIIVEGFYDPKTGENSLHSNYNLWADFEQLKGAYPLKGRLYQFRSEVVYFGRSAQTRRLFEKAREIQAHPKIDSLRFGGYVPDEFGLNVAASVMDYRPHKEREFQPSYWFNITKKMLPLHILAQKYYLLSVGGNYSGPAVKKLYNQVMAGAFHKMRLQHIFPLQSKRDSIKERSTM